MKSKYGIFYDLIDGTGEKWFKDIGEAAKYVLEREDFGDDGRRSWGIQAEFGQFYFEGFTWRDIEEYERLEAEKEKLVMKVTRLEHSDYWWEFTPYRYDVRYLGECFHINGHMGRLEVTFFDSPDDAMGPEDCGYFTLGTYDTYEAAISAIERWMAGDSVSRKESIFYPVILPVEFCVTDWTGAENVPF